MTTSAFVPSDLCPNDSWLCPTKKGLPEVRRTVMPHGVIRYAVYKPNRREINIQATKE